MVFNIAIMITKIPCIFVLECKRLEEQVIQEEGTSQALREDLTEKENGLQQLRKAMKEVSCTVELNRFKISLLLSWYELEVCYCKNTVQ